MGRGSAGVQAAPGQLTMASQAPSLSYVGSNFLRQRLVLSTLSGRPVKIRKIRAKDDNPGLRGWLVRELRGESLGTIWEAEGG